jgi:protein-L-isoaspartate(D-aspartate) O-methyltransferase
MRATFVSKNARGETITTQPWDTIAPRLSGFGEDSKFSF